MAHTPCMSALNEPPRDGDFAALVERAATENARGASGLPPVAPAAAEPVLTQAQREERWRPVFDYVTASRFRLVGLLAMLTVALFASMTALVAGALQTRLTAVYFVVDTYVPPVISQILRAEVHARDGVHRIEAAETFAATGKAPPGYAVQQRGTVHDVDDSEARAARGSLWPAFFVSLALALLFWWGFLAQARRLLRLVPGAVPRRAFWVLAGALLALDLVVYMHAGFAGLGLLLFVLGGSTQALWLLVRQVRRRVVVQAQ
jgi:hypothetical protein